MRSPWTRSTYPRVCGEHCVPGCTGRRTNDLPPRVRGAHLGGHAVLLAHRLTPACAGSTVGDSLIRAADRPYPRVCGEHGRGRSRRALDSDLPPRVRGAPPPHPRDRHEGRLTPACAGSTRLHGAWGAGVSTYPRVCGEHGQWIQGRRPVDRLTPACSGSTNTASRSPATSSTYPRVCGEHASVPPDEIKMIDLPPRVRGAPRPGRPAAAVLRLTPACAGSTLDAPGLRLGDPTYPRVCGEHPSLDFFAGPLDRLTPACAGSTSSPRSCNLWVSTYPRVCGEHASGGSSWTTITDLPPRVRGALDDLPSVVGECRLTPACAGSTGSRRGLSISVADLPPRVRGAPGRHPPRRGQRRLTPACAGSTRPNSTARSCLSTYPRVCGEHSQSTIRSLRCCDLPPRVRGALVPHLQPRRADRLTPACAGSTSWPLASRRRLSTYPRVCGEHCSMPFPRRSGSDLPPRVRGALRQVARRQHRPRLTPACAGSTGGAPSVCAASTTYPRVCGEH